jgi:hypothetical protein
MSLPTMSMAHHYWGQDGVINYEGYAGALEWWEKLWQAPQVATNFTASSIIANQ